jgi:hypothetical protein
MLRERAVGESLWEAVLPAELRELPAELAKVAAILDDDRVVAPFRVRLTARVGRPTIAIETYLRLMCPKHRYGLGYETLCREADQAAGTGVGGGAQRRVQRGRGRGSLPAIDRLTGEIAERAKQTMHETRRLACELARTRGRRKQAVAPLLNRLESELEAAEQILAQTDLRLAGQRTMPNRRVSLVDPDARPIHTGTPGGRAIRFGSKARVADTAEGFVIADVPGRGAPVDGSLLDGALARARRAGTHVRCVSTPTAASAPRPPGSAASPSATTCSAWRCSADQ